MAAKKRYNRTRTEPCYRKDSDMPGQGIPGEQDRRRSLLSLPSTLFFVLLLFLAGSFAFYCGHRSSTKPNSNSLSIYERSIAKSDVGFQGILDVKEKEHARVMHNRSVRHFLNPVLAYITPWNSRGYEVVKEFTSKFTHISPVWYDLKSHGKNLFLDGQNNADSGWVSDLKKSGNVLVLPRIVLETFPDDLLLKKKQWSKACNIILKECKEMEYDGIVLESWSRWAQYGVLHHPEMRKMALEFIKQLGRTMHSVNSVNNASHPLELIYVIPAPRSQNLADYDFGPQDLQEIVDYVDGFSLMTYDFSGPHPGPNAPLNWIRSSLQQLLGDSNNEEGDALMRTPLIFLGLNLYGYDFVLSEGSGGRVIVGGDYLSLLEKHRPAVLHWDKKSEEHYFVYSHDNVRHAVFYPSLVSISARLDEARVWGAGLSLWEIGQGLDYFYELL